MQSEIENNSLLTYQSAGTITKTFAVSILALLLYKITTYPENTLCLTAILLIYGFILRKYPHAWLIALPAILPIADLSPWTGRLFFTEFDYFMLLSLAISLWYGRWKSPLKIIKPSALLLICTYTLLYLISLLKGLFPFQPIDANAFSNYYSQYNSFRVAKGFTWALLLLPLIAHSFQQQQNIKKNFTYGILLGLAATASFALWERYIFTGLFNYSSDFRITSTFYSMHTGGAHLDAFLILSMPFIAFLVIESKNKIIPSLLALLLFSISLYTLLVTYTRGTYIAFACTSIILVVGLLICRKKNQTSNFNKILWLTIFIGTVSLITQPILNGSFIQNRFNRSAQEVGIRTHHWLASINMMEPDFLTSLFGMGVGSFPRTYLWKNVNGTAPATYQLQQTQTDTYLEIGSGAPIYIEQKINISADTHYNLSFDYRSQTYNNGLHISICEKAIQHSFNCQPLRIKNKKKSNDWQHIETSFNTKKATESFVGRPTKFILENNQNNTTVDIKNISLASNEGINILQNGNFSQGMDHWFFTSDSHIPWRTENLWVQILFDQGLLGLIALNLILLHLVYHLYHQVKKKKCFSAIILSSFTGFMVIGITDSPFDMPMISLLFFLIYFIALLKPNKEQ